MQTYARTTSLEDDVQDECNLPTINDSSNYERHNLLSNINAPGETDGNRADIIFALSVEYRLR